MKYGFNCERSVGNCPLCARIKLLNAQPIGIFAFWEYYKAGNADIKIAAVLAFGFAIGGYFGGVWAQHIPELALRRIFAVLLAAVSIKMFLSK